MQGDKFQTDDELKLNALNWLLNHDKTFDAAGASNFSGHCEKVCSYKWRIS
jgi:hypothetical protein